TPAGLTATRESRIDTYRAANGALGALWILLYNQGIPFDEVDFDYDGNWFATHRVVTGQPSHGTVTVASDGSFTYTPQANFFGDDSFTYIAQGLVTALPPTTVTIHVLPVNDAPIAVSDTYTFSAGGVTAGANNGVLQNDSDPDGDALTAVLV